MFRRNLILGSAVLWLTACGAQATLTTDQQTYTPSSEVVLRLQNDSRQTLIYHLGCFAKLQRHEGGSWTSLDSSDDMACAAVLESMLVLEPGSHAEYHRNLDVTLPAGEYRYDAMVTWLDDGGDVSGSEYTVSNTFNVTHTSAP